MAKENDPDYVFSGEQLAGPGAGAEGCGKDRVLWSMEGADGVVTVVPMDGTEITIHGEDEAELFIKCLRDYFPKE